MCCNVSQFGAVNLFAQVRLLMARSLLLLVLALIAVDAHANTDKFPPNPSAVQPSALTPPFGSTAGGQLVFFKIKETTASKGRASVVCLFAASPAFSVHSSIKTLSTQSTLCRHVECGVSVFDERVLDWIWQSGSQHVRTLKPALGLIAGVVDCERLVRQTIVDHGTHSCIEFWSGSIVAR